MFTASFWRDRRSIAFHCMLYRYAVHAVDTTEDVGDEDSSRDSSCFTEDLLQLHCGQQEAFTGSLPC